MYVVGNIKQLNSLRIYLRQYSQEMLFRKNSSLLLDLSSVSVVEHQQKGEEEEEQAGRKGTK